VVRAVEISRPEGLTVGDMALCLRAALRDLSAVAPRAPEGR
jgi:hypothetical protein